jgi:hypothetical protein
LGLSNSDILKNKKMNLNSLQSKKEIEEFLYKDISRLTLLQLRERRSAIKILKARVCWSTEFYNKLTESYIETSNALHDRQHNKLELQ